jgi:anti-anti-sigma factor
MELSISVQHHDDRAMIKLGGEVDLATCPQLRGVLVELIDRGFHQLTIDLEQVGFLDCTGIGVLVDALRRVREHGGCLNLVRPRPFVLRVLTLTGMTTLLPTDPPDGEATTPTTRPPAAASREA